MRGTGQLLPIIGLLATMAGASYMVVRLGAQEPGSQVSATNPAFAEVRDAQGQIVLRGEFALTGEDDDEVERTALLKPTGSDADAAGKAEVEIPRRAAAGHEIEFDITNVDPGQSYTFAIDGQDVATAVADRRGRIELERRVRDGRVQ